MLLDTIQMKEMLGRRSRNLQQLIEIEESVIESKKLPLSKQYFDSLEVKNVLVFQLNMTIELNSIIEEYENNFRTEPDLS